MKSSLTFRKLFAYLLTFLLVLVLFLTLTDFWKKVDYEYFKSVYLSHQKIEEDQLANDIRIVDIPKVGKDPIAYRRRIVKFLQTVDSSIKANKISPKAIILDISFSREEDTIELNKLYRTLETLKKKKIKLYAVYSLKNWGNNPNLTYNENDYEQASILYDELFDGGRLHVGFRLENNLITYDSQIVLKNAFGRDVVIPALVTKAAKDLKGGQLTNPTMLEKFVAPFNPDEEEIISQTHQFIISENDKDEVSIEPKLSQEEGIILLVGALGSDILPNTDNVPGTYALAWALNEQRLGDDSLAKQPLDSIAIIIGQTLFFALLTVFIFALLFKYVKRLQTKPKILAAVSFLLGSLLLFVYGYVILYTDYVIPIGLTLVAMLIAAVLSSRFAYKFLVTGIAEGSQKWDVFISYSHGNSKWVKENVYQPLQEFRKPNGDKLTIFFDEKSIGFGEAFTAKYMWGIVDSKIFIPVISEEYYGKNHCKNEMDLAYKRHVEKLIALLPIVFSYEAVPEIYQHINFLDCSKNENFMEKVKSTIVALDEKSKA